MFKNRDSLIVELKKGAFRKFFISALAEEANNEGDGNSNPSSNKSQSNSAPYNFEEMIARVRREEKDKLYSRIEGLEKDNNSLTSSLNTQLLRNAALFEELEKLKQKNSETDSEEVSKLKGENDRLRGEIQTLKESSPKEEEIRSAIEKEYELKMYIKDKISENKDSILSMFTSEIKGSTKEEVDSSIEAVKEKTLSIKKDLGLVDENGNPVSTNKGTTTKEDKKTKVKKPPVSAPSEGSEEETFDADYIRGLDPRSPEYAEFRKKIGLK